MSSLLHLTPWPSFEDVYNNSKAKRSLDVHWVKRIFFVQGWLFSDLIVIRFLCWKGGQSLCSFACRGFGGTRWLVTMVQMELPDEPGIKDVSSLEPWPLYWTIPLPVDKVLQASPTSAGTKQASNHVGWASIYESGRRWRWSSRNQWALSNRLDLGDVAC